MTFRENDELEIFLDEQLGATTVHSIFVTAYCRVWYHYDLIDCI